MDFILGFTLCFWGGITAAFLSPFAGFCVIAAGLFFVMRSL